MTEPNEPRPSNPAHPLEGARAKLRRANEHRHEIESRIELWREDRPHDYIRDKESEPGWTILRLRTVKPPPLELGVLVGDFVHNVRSALDHAVWQLVIANGADPGRHNQFPITLTEEQFDKRAIAGKTAMLAGVSDTVQTYVRRQQPYHRGDGATTHPLAILHKLWNTDKHRTISRVATLFEPQRVYGHGDLPAFEASSKPLKEGMVIDRWPTPTPRPPNPDGSVTGYARASGRVETGVLFGESQITLNTLISLRGTAKEIVEHFSSPYFWPAGS